MTYDRIAEVELLLEADTSRTGIVWRYMQEGLSMSQMQERLGNATPPTNETIVIRALRDGVNPQSPSTANLASSKIRSWVKNKPLSNELRQAFDTQLLELETPGFSGLPATTIAQTPSVPEDPRPFTIPVDTDRDVLTTARREQSRLRDHLLQGRSEAECDLCGALLPKDLLVAAHIVPRSELDHTERGQFDSIAMVACLFGCDRLFELGYLSVDDAGTVCISAAQGDLEDELADRAGYHCGAHNTKTAGAFAQQRARFQA